MICAAAGGVFLFACTGTIHDVLFQFNTAGTNQPDIGGFGGGLFLLGGDVVVDQCQFLDNRGMNGGAVGIHSRPTGSGPMIPTVATLANCTFERNYSDFQTGGAIWSATGDPLNGGVESRITARGCRFAGNVAQHFAGWVDQNTVQLLVEDCQFIDNHTVGFGGGFGQSQTAGVDVEPAGAAPVPLRGQPGWRGQPRRGRVRSGDQRDDGELRSCREFRRQHRALRSADRVRRGREDAAHARIASCATTRGRGVLATEADFLQVINSTIVNNQTSLLDAGGISTSTAPAQIVNTIAWGNTGLLGGQGGQISTSGGPGQVTYCIVQDLSGFAGGVWQSRRRSAVREPGRRRCAPAARLAGHRCGRHPDGPGRWAHHRFRRRRALRR